MAAGDISVTLVGSYDTIALAIAGMNTVNVPDHEHGDHVELYIEPGIGSGRYRVLKYVILSA